MKRWNVSLVGLLLSVSASAVTIERTTDYLITWVMSPDPEVAGFVVYRSAHPDTGFTVIDSVAGDVTAYIDPGLEKGIFYYYKIRAKDAACARGSFSNVVGGMTIPQDAEGEMHDRCRVTAVDECGSSEMEVAWVTQAPTMGFVQYGEESLDSMALWEGSGYSQVHDSIVVEVPGTSDCYVRAVSYDTAGLMVISATVLGTVTGDDHAESPGAILLEQNYPNPFNPSTTIIFRLHEEARVDLRVYDSAGRLVATLVDGIRRAGTHSVLWNGRTDDGRLLASGVYFCRLSAGALLQTRKMVLLR